jgi:predicted O-methyltransferase YrrM
MKNFIRKFFRWLPVSWKARIEFYLDKSLGKEFGGPFNGQAFRQKIFRDLIRKCEPDAIIETGTFRGVTTGFMVAEADKPVYTVEAEPRFYYYAKQNLRKHKKIQVSLGDSRKFIEKLSKDQSLSGKNVFFYLDAHWHEDLPLYKEIELIGDTWDKAVVMIDDFEVPDDPGYKYDNYGETKRLSLSYVVPLLGNRWSVFFPSAKSADETGLKRGCVILVREALKENVKEIDSLRIYMPNKKVVGS